MIPIIVGVLGTIPKNLEKKLEEVETQGKNKPVPTTVLLKLVRILKRTVMFHVLLRWPTMPELEIGGMAVDVEPFSPITHRVLLCYGWQLNSSLAKRHPTWKCLRNRNVSLNSYIHIHRRFLNVYVDQTVDLSTVRWYVIHFSHGHSYRIVVVLNYVLI